METDDISYRIYALVKAIGQEAEKLHCIKEEGRKLFRFVKRTEVLVSDLQPYAKQKSLVAVWATLKDIETALTDIVSLLGDLKLKGPLSIYLQADSNLARFQSSTKRLHDALGHLVNVEHCLPEETQEELASVRSLLQRAKFELKPEHQAVVTKYRSACDSLREPFNSMLDACEDMLAHVHNADFLTKEGFVAAIEELQQEVDYVNQQGFKDEEYYLRMMMDIVRIHHVQTDSPLEYLCPLTHQVMMDPVVLHETGHSYERQAIQDWYSKGHHFCPRSGIPLKRLTLSPNGNLRDAIQRWRLHNDMQLSFRPVLAALTQDMQQQQPQQPDDTSDLSKLSRRSGGGRIPGSPKSPRLSTVSATKSIMQPSSTQAVVGPAAPVPVPSHPAGHIHLSSALSVAGSLEPLPIYDWGSTASSERDGLQPFRPEEAIQHLDTLVESSGVAEDRWNTAADPNPEQPTEAPAVNPHESTSAAHADLTAAPDHSQLRPTEEPGADPALVLPNAHSNAIVSSGEADTTLLPSSLECP